MSIIHLLMIAGEQRRQLLIIKTLVINIEDGYMPWGRTNKKQKQDSRPELFQSSIQFNCHVIIMNAALGTIIKGNLN